MYIIWSKSKGVPTKVHGTYREAREESRRLAAKHPGFEFGVYKLRSTSYATVEVETDEMPVFS